MCEVCEQQKMVEDKKENRKQLKHCEGYNIFGFPQGERYPRYPSYISRIEYAPSIPETEKQLYEYKRGNGSKTARTHKCQPGMIN